MWNDTDIPLAHLITFRCYGTWLHGDQRGSVDREHNRYQRPYAAANENRKAHNRKTLKGEPVVLHANRRESVEKAIRETCDCRKWTLHAINVRTNHVHVVDDKIRTGIECFQSKRDSTNEQYDCWKMDYSPWVDKGSRRNLWNERSIVRAIDHVLNSQGDELPDFD